MLHENLTAYDHVFTYIALDGSYHRLHGKAREQGRFRDVFPGKCLGTASPHLDWIPLPSPGGRRLDNTVIQQI